MGTYMRTDHGPALLNMAVGASLYYFIAKFMEAQMHNVYHRTNKLARAYGHLHYCKLIYLQF